MKNLIHEIHRRSLWQVLGIYLAGSWVALQVVETLSESMTLPDWVQGFSVILLVLGLPVVLATAFVQEGVGKKATKPTGESDAPADDAGVAGGDESEAGPSTVTGATPATTSRSAGGFFTWKRAVLGGVGAAALLAVALGGWAALRSLGIGPAGTLVAKGVLEDQATLLLTDFVAEDASLSRAATEAFRVDLDQSSVIDLADPGYVTAVLGLMRRDADVPLDLDIGRELAIREGMPAVIGGEITRAGTGYVLTSQLLTPDTGEILVSDRETASDDSELIPAIDRLSKKLRERIGESLGDLASGPALESVTTGNLDALQLYTRALRAGDEGDAELEADLLEEALVADTAFAMAWRRLGMAHMSGGGRLGNRGRGIEALGRAYQLRDRLTQRERDLATAGYYAYVERDDRRTADAYERMLDRDPEDVWALNNLALTVGIDLGEDEQAEALQLRAISIDSLSNTNHWNLSVTQARLGKYDESAETLANWRRRVPGDALAALFAGGLAAARRDYPEAERRALEALEVRPGNASDEQFSLAIRTAVATTRGELATAEELSGSAERLAASSVGPAPALGVALQRVGTWLDVRGRPDEAARALTEALDAYPIDAMGPFDVPWDALISLTARTGEVGEARVLLERWEAADPNASIVPEHARASAWIAIESGDPSSAIETMRGVRSAECRPCDYAVAAAAWAQTGPADSTIAALERYVDTPGMFRVVQDQTSLAASLEDLGQLYDEKGDLQNAALYYAQFVELWADADDELQPRVRAAQARLEEILREIG